MNLHNIYKERGEDFSKLVCSNESCSIDCLENINFNKTTTLAIIDGVIEGMEILKEPDLCECDKPKDVMNRCEVCKLVIVNKYPMEDKVFDYIEVLQAQRALITKE